MFCITVLGLMTRFIYSCHTYADILPSAVTTLGYNLLQWLSWTHEESMSEDAWDQCANGWLPCALINNNKQGEVKIKKSLCRQKVNTLQMELIDVNQI